MKTQNTSNIKHWNKCELYIHLRKMNEKSVKIILFQPVYFISGSWVEGACPGRLEDKVDLTLHRMPFHFRVQSHPHSFRLGQCRKSESSRKTHATMGRVSNLHTDRGPGGNYCIFLISVVIRQHWTKWALFEDLLYMCLAKLLKFCHVHNGNNNSTYLIRGCNAWCSEHVNLGVLDIF